MVILNYIVLAQPEYNDDRTLDDLFYNYGQPLKDIEVAIALIGY